MSNVSSSPVPTSNTTNPVVDDVGPVTHSVSNVADKDVPRETSPRPEPALVEDYRAIGTEPFWAVIIQGQTATLKRPGVPNVSFKIEKSGSQFAELYQGNGFSMRISPGPCSDGMSDDMWSDRVQVAFSEGTLKGCGGRKDESAADIELR